MQRFHGQLPRALSLAGGLALVIGGMLVPLPADMIRVRILTVVLGILLYMTALARPFQGLLARQRKYIALREATDRLLALVRELNQAALEARAMEYQRAGYFEPILRQMHEEVDRLPTFAGETSAGAPPEPQGPIH
ncbi:MAG: hypothetical protein P8Z36_13160 [Gemmatimonadota bacterium]|jgi:hypothetical protein